MVAFNRASSRARIDIGGVKAPTSAVVLLRERIVDNVWNCVELRDLTTVKFHRHAASNSLVSGARIELYYGINVRFHCSFELPNSRTHRGIHARWAFL